MIAASLEGLAFAALPGRSAADPLPEAGAHGLTTRVVRVEGPRRRLHRHPHSAELTYVLSGRGEHVQEDERRAVAAGDVVLVPAGVAHATTADPGAPLTLLCVFPHPDLTANIEELDREVVFGG